MHGPIDCVTRRERVIFIASSLLICTGIHLSGKMADIYERIYQDLKHLGVLEVRQYAVIHNDPYPPLCIDRLAPDHFAIAHNRNEDGTLVPDPDMEIRVFPDKKMAEPLTYQDANGRRIVYPEPGRVDLKTKNELTVYLGNWLKDLVEKGYHRE
jgi:hypothetical protein